MFADSFEQVNRGSIPGAQMRRTTGYILLTDHVERAVACARDARRDGQSPARGECCLVRAGLNLDASPVPDGGSMLVDPLDEAKGESLPAEQWSTGALICPCLRRLARRIDLIPRDGLGKRGSP